MIKHVKTIIDVSQKCFHFPFICLQSCLVIYLCLFIYLIIPPFFSSSLYRCSFFFFFLPIISLFLYFFPSLFLLNSSFPSIPHLLPPLPSFFPSGYFSFSLPPSPSLSFLYYFLAFFSPSPPSFLLSVDYCFFILPSSSSSFRNSLNHSFIPSFLLPICFRLSFPSLLSIHRLNYSLLL